MHHFTAILVAWGLRDYGIPPSIWGGAQECEHEWGEPVRTAWANSVAGPSQNRPKNGNVYRCDTKLTGPFCQHCGAWAGAHGFEPTYQLYVENAVAIFREVWRVLRSDGTLWLNLGDSYATGGGKHPGGGEQGARWKGGPPSGKSTLRGNGHVGGGPKLHALDPVPVANRGVHTAEQSGKQGYRIDQMGPMTQPNRMPQSGLKPKDLVGIPWRVAFALQADGWYLRQDIIWSKPNPMPESVTDRCTKAHEYLFLLSKSERYYFDAESIAEPVTESTIARMSQPSLDQQAGSDRVPGKTNGPMRAVPPRFGGAKYGDNDAEEHRTKSGNDYEIKTGKRNRRSVWTVATQPFSDAHFATFPPALIEPCILAGCPTGGVVLDPFGGAGTTGLVADRLQRNAILIELNPEYAAMARNRIDADAGMFSTTKEASP